MSQQYIKLVIELDDEYQEQLIADLFDYDFDGFEQHDDHIVAYIVKNRFSDVSREDLEEILAAYPVDTFVRTEEIVEEQNWNEEWEASIQPLQVGDFFIKPTWSTQAVPEGAILLEIDPKMAFGTGYHETTRLMLRQLQHLDVRDKTMLDAGTGTGILAIAAIKKGAQQAIGFDVDSWSYQNALENAYINEVAEDVTFLEGSTDVIPEDPATYDLVLANINRNILVEIMLDLTSRVSPGGSLILSGLLETDEPTIRNLEALTDWTLKDRDQEGEWICLRFSRGSV
ncbi:MAG: 50S ribosomal protein L11 methyltransferase [Bacteroidota bacterium]